MECVRYIKITVEINTNKRTLVKKFDSIEEAEEWLGEKIGLNWTELK